METIGDGIISEIKPCKGKLPVDRIRDAAPALLDALEEYMRANKALSACSYDDPIKLRAARDDFFDAERDANAAIAAARGE